MRQPPAKVILNKWQRQRFERGTRYYELILCQDLWGSWEVVRLFGRIETRQAKVLTEPITTYHKARMRFDELAQYRIKRRRYAPVVLSDG